MASPTADLANGLIALLQTAGVGTYSPDTAPDETSPDVAIVLKMLPSAPDRALVIDVVPTSDDPSMPLGEIAVRLRGRGARNDPLDVDTILDAAFDQLHGLTGVPLGSVIIRQLLRRPSGVQQLGFDGNRRWRRDDQYIATVDYPPTTLRPEGGAW